MADLQQPKWNEIRQSLLQPYTPWTGMRVPWKVQRGWELESGECGVSPGGGLLLTAERQIEGRRGREEIVMRHACGGKPGGHGSKAILLSHA